jgi:nitrilase
MLDALEPAVAGTEVWLRVYLDLPENLPGCEAMTARGDWVAPGNASVLAPASEAPAGPVRAEIGLLHAEPDLAAIAQMRRRFDGAGRSSRPEVFTLRVESAGKQPVEFR